MRKAKLLSVIVILIIAVPLVFISCSTSQTDNTEKDQEKPQDVEQTLPDNTDTSGDNINLSDAEVDIVNFTFTPNEITIPLGTTVIWSNIDSVPHTVTSTEGFFDSDTILGGGTFSFTFDKVGTYPYFCTLHPYMKATIIVE